ncbi:hypothetical protein L13192_10728 [Pyrenophora tritici-repentis]|nr:hypothetical protein L13192_10728 [Pyrenophora tritici-repentis]
MKFSTTLFTIASLAISVLSGVVLPSNDRDIPMAGLEANIVDLKTLQVRDAAPSYLDDRGIPIGCLANVFALLVINRIGRIDIQSHIDNLETFRRDFNSNINVNLDFTQAFEPLRFVRFSIRNNSQLVSNALILSNYRDTAIGQPRETIRISIPRAGGVAIGTPAPSTYTGCVELPRLDEDWSLWLFQHKDKAVSHGVWEYCNPAVSTPPTLTPKPERPILPDGDLTAEVLQVQRMKLSEWEWKYKEWHQKDKALKEICTDVASTISTSLIPLIQNDATAHARLAKLRAHIAPSDPTRRRELRVKYDALRSPKPRNTSVDKWLDEWIRVTDLMAMLDMPEMKGGQVQEEFLVTANKLHETWATAELRKLLDLQENPAVKDLDLPTINTLVASFRQFLRIIKPQGSTFGTFGASLGIADSSGSTKANTTEEGPSQNQKPQAKHNHPPGKCICLEEHWYSNCPYINPAVRRAGWTLDPEIEAKFKKAKKNPRIAKQLQRAAERQNAKATSEPTTTPIAFDAQAHGDHQPHSMACSFQAFSTNHVSNPPYINRWIMDPGSNVHVINSKSWRWTHTRYSTADEALYAGSQTPNGIQDIQLTHVALVEGFFANILSLSRCKDMKIHFDSGKNHLYQATPNNVVALLDYHAGHWLIDADDGKRPNANSLQSMAAFRPSHDPKPHLKATATEAHHIWAHLGPDTIRHLEAAVRGFKLQGSDPPQSWKECEDCILTKMNKQISRRTPDTVSTRPFERIAIDLVYLVPQGEECVG